MNKLTLKLRPEDVANLAQLLGWMMTRQDVQTLKQEQHWDYLMFACVHEFYNKLDAKQKEIAAFGCTPGRMIRVSMKRHEALALFFLMAEGNEETGTYLPALTDLSVLLIREIRGLIYKQFLV